MEGTGCVCNSAGADDEVRDAEVTSFRRPASPQIALIIVGMAREYRIGPDPRRRAGLIDLREHLDAAPVSGSGCIQTSGIRRVMCRQYECFSRSARSRLLNRFQGRQEPIALMCVLVILAQEAELLPRIGVKSDQIEKGSVQVPVCRVDWA